MLLRFEAAGFARSTDREILQIHLAWLQAMWLWLNPQALNQSDSEETAHLKTTMAILASQRTSLLSLSFYDKLLCDTGFDQATEVIKDATEL